MNNKYIGFTSKDGEAWDKLKDMKVGETFTTFRGYGPKKDKWYEDNIGETYIVSLDRKPIAKAVLKEKTYTWSDEIPLEVIKKDTFQDFTEEKWADQMEQFYGNRKVFGYMLTFEIIDVEETK